jgi:hypothetical protein
MKMRASVICLAVLASSAFAQEQDQTVAVGPWEIKTTYKTDKFENCSMSRTVGDLRMRFVQAEDSLLLMLDSAKWKLDRGKAYPVRLRTGTQSVEAKALAETNSVTIALADETFNARLRAANVLEVRGEGATLRVPLDKSAVALRRLEVCFEKNTREGPETNPFVAPNRKP